MSSAASVHILEPGTTLGRYRIVRPLGAGGMGAVYEAVHEALGRPVALKTLHPTAIHDPNVVARLVREGQAASRIRHPHVVDVTDVGVDAGIPYLVMELLEGESLGHLLEREGRLSAARTLAILLPVMAALAAAHEQGVFHRDLKPENIFLARSRHGAEEPKLLDFGISRMEVQTTSVSLTDTGALLGTPAYMSPEQARGAKGVDARSDQYSLGVILYECLAGTRPYVSDTVLAIVHDIVTGAVVPMRTHAPDAPEAYTAAVERAMQLAPDDRFASVQAMAEALVALADDAVRARWEPVFRAGAAQPPARLASASASGGMALAATAEASVSDRGSPRSRPVLHSTLASSATTLQPRHERARGRAGLALLAGALVALAAAGALVATRSQSGRSDHTAARAAAPAPPPSGTTTTPLGSPSAQQPAGPSVQAPADMPAPAPVTAGVSAPDTPSPAPAATAAPVTPLRTTAAPPSAVEQTAPRASAPLRRAGPGGRLVRQLRPAASPALTPPHAGRFRVD